MGQGVANIHRARQLPTWKSLRCKSQSIELRTQEAPKLSTYARPFSRRAGDSSSRTARDLQTGGGPAQRRKVERVVSWLDQEAGEGQVKQGELRKFTNMAHA